jgi:hypothetical protein
MVANGGEFSGSGNAEGFRSLGFRQPAFYGRFNSLCSKRTIEVIDTVGDPFVSGMHISQDSFQSLSASCSRKSGACCDSSGGLVPML